MRLFSVIVVMLVVLMIRVARAAFMAGMRVANVRVLVEENESDYVHEEAEHRDGQERL